MNDLKDILAEIMLEDVLDREGQDYKIGRGSSGEQLNIRECPFCHGSSWKVYANRDTGLGNCFHGSCGQTFNIFTFTAALLDGSNKSAADYLRRLATSLGWRPKRREDRVVETYGPENWTLPDSYPLPTTNGQMLKYLLDRRVSAKTAQYFGLRYCLDGWFNYDKPDGERGGMYFGERVLIPIYDLDGTMVTFQGRDITGESDRKYLFPPGLPGTGRFLYNGQNAAGKATIVVCEGAFDVIRTHVNTRDHAKWQKAGVIGTFGIHLSTGEDGNDQKNRFLRLIDQGLKEVIMFWDGEKEAFTKAVRAGMVIKSLGVNVRMARPPDDKDPGDLTVAETITALEAAFPLDRTTALRLRLGTFAA